MVKKKRGSSRERAQPGVVSPALEAEALRVREYRAKDSSRIRDPKSAEGRNERH